MGPVTFRWHDAQKSRLIVCITAAAQDLSVGVRVIARVRIISQQEQHVVVHCDQIVIQLHICETLDLIRSYIRIHTLHTTIEARNFRCQQPVASLRNYHTFFACGGVTSPIREHYW